MIRTIIKRLREKRDQSPSTETGATIDEASTAALIARRAMRTSNRRSDVAAAYEAKHLILARGAK